MGIDDIDEGLLNDAAKIAEMSDQEILTLTLGAEDEDEIANYQMAMMLKLKREIYLLNENIKKFIKSNKFSSWTMIILTIIIGFLTVAMIFK